MDEPAFAEVVVARCTSPVVSSYDDVVAERLVRDVQNRRQRFNVAAARYAVDLAHGLAVINANNVWGENGHLVNLIALVEKGPWPGELPLTLEERLLHFRLFLEADGAALLFLAQLVLSEGQLPLQGSDWNALAERMFVETYSLYLAVTGPTADRVSLRSDIDRIKARGYKGKSGAHKLFLHLQTLHRLDFLERTTGSNERQYNVSGVGEARLARLVNEIPDILALEEIIREHRSLEVAALVYGLGGQLEDPSPSETLSLVLPKYREVMATGVAICPLAPIIEAAQITLLADTSRIMGYADFLDRLKEAQSLHPRDIRFHQDRWGRPAFLKISDELIRDTATRDTLR